MIDQTLKIQKLLLRWQLYSYTGKTDYDLLLKIRLYLRPVDILLESNVVFFLFMSNY